MFTLLPGEIFTNRFEIDRMTGSGGMGTVYRARDQLSGDWVALKVLHAVAARPQESSRFAREAQLLTDLRHPGIVKLVAHGVAPTGHAYLAMEWLDGMDLRQRLQRGGLGLSESLHLLRRVATALATMHSRGIVHRDLKPSNLFLRDGEIARATLIDFGIARRGTPSQAITGTGNIIGTPEYMAPEQARGEAAFAAATDIFSLGCILFECLTGAPPFVGERLATVLAKLLFERPRDVLELRPDLPAEVGQLVHRLLAKEPGERPADALVLLAELDKLMGLDAPAPLASSGRERAAVVSDSDQGLVCVLVATPVDPPDEAGEETLDSVAMQARHALRRQIRRIMESAGARVESMADGSLVATFIAARGTATDLVAEAVRTALQLRDAWPEARIALATGRGALSGPMAVGEALDRAGEMARGGAATPAPDRLLLDEITAGLLDTRFRTRRTPSGTFELSSAELSADESRLLLGKPTPCVGREAELAALEAALATTIEDSHSRAVLVTAPPGIGKSRLRHEFLRRAAMRSESVRVLLGRGDPLATRSAYSLFGQAVRRLCTVQDGEPVAVRRQKLRQRVEAAVPAGEAPWVAELLGEICAVPFPDEDSPKLRAARRDPQLMGEWVQAAVLTFLRAECNAQPVLLVLEDLHWGDTPTMRLIGLALAELSELPLLVLALARPELSEQFPSLWAGYVLPLPLRPLGKKASERLAVQTLGSAATPAALARIVEQAAGNALYLEELIRAVAEGKGDEPPGTVLAMLQARISGLDVGARRVLRAASAFGETFWLGGVRALLGVDERQGELASQIDALISAEIVAPRRDSRFSGERELHFRHVLMRDAAYALLGEEERRACHRLCLSYLEQIGEVDPAVLSEHALRAADAERALRYVAQAAQHAFDRCDADAAERLASMGLSHGAQGEMRGAVLATLLWVYSIRQRYADLFAIAMEALSLLPENSARWLFVINQTLAACRATGRHDILSDMIRLHERSQPGQDATILYAGSACTVTTIYLSQGLRAPIHHVLDDCERVIDQASSDQDGARAFLRLSRSFLEFRIDPEPFAALADAQAAARAFKEYGHRYYRCISANHLAMVSMFVGCHDEGVALLQEMIAEAQRFREPFYATMATLNLVVGLSELGSPEAAAQAIFLGRPILAAAAAPAALVHIAQPHLAEALSRAGEHEEGERLARDALAALSRAPLYRVVGYKALAAILLQQGRSAAARASAEEGLVLLQSLGGCGYAEVPLRLVLAEARHADGDTAAAHQALRDAVAQLRRRARDAPSPGSREQYLSAVPVHRRVVALAEQWWGEHVT